jgi:hypothetical protein
MLIPLRSPLAIVGTLEIWQPIAKASLSFWVPPNPVASLVYFGLMTLASFQLGLMTKAPS